MKIAVIGTGISGLSAAYMLHEAGHEIVVYEKDTRLGGHSRTIDVDDGAGKTVAVDTGFIVFNNWNYPHLFKLFDHLGVAYQKSDMSFGVSIDDGWLEYASGGMFAQRSNWLRPAFWGMIFDILRFKKKALRVLDEKPDITLGACLDQLQMGDWFRRYYLLAMGAAIWSSPVQTIMQFPARSFLQFFKNHGLLNITKRPQWYTVTGGSREYIAKLTAGFKDQVRLDCAAIKVERKDNRVYVHDSQGEVAQYDYAVLACHADAALDMIESPSDDERAVLGAFGYQDNKIVVHSDASFMPQRRACWASWVYLNEERRDGKSAVSLSYWMNNLQSLPTETDVLVTLNPARPPAAETVMDEYHFTHPVFDSGAVKAQHKIAGVQGVNGLLFCGAYQGYGFHEDGLSSAVHAVEVLGVKPPWV